MTYRIRDIEVHFPFKPYDVQEKFMEKVIECLDGSFEGEKYEFCISNGLLESPTGTGKTLSTLCSCLAWLNHHKEKLAEEGINPLPRIVFATRTHSQIRQIVSEIKGTAYEPKVCVLSSRKQLCINPPSGNASNEDIRANCLDKIRSGKCQYYHSSFDDRNYQVGNQKPIEPVEGILDIEELCNLGRKECYCPYYYQRKIALKECEFIILPYNYLVNPGIKKSIQLGLSNSILIFDEAHNLEKICESLSSFFFDSNMFVNCVKELGVLVDVKYRIGRMNPYQELRRPVIMKLREMIVELEQQILRDFFSRSNPTKYERQDRVLILRGSYFAKQFSECLDMTHEDQDGVSERMKLIYECQRDLRQMKPEVSEGCRRSPGLTSLRHVLNQFFSFTTLTREKMKKYYRFIITQKPQGFKKNFAAKEVSRYYKEYKDFEYFKEEVPYFTYEYFCLSPSIAMYELLYSKISIKNYDAMKGSKKPKKKKRMKDEEEGYEGYEEEEVEEDGENLIDPNEHDGGELPPKCVILISGTLSPLPFFEKSFEIPFPIRLQNQHTIKKSQLSALVCTTGPSKGHLSSEFSNRGNPKYVKEIGDVIINICRIVPNGILVFFPSFQFLNDCLQIWKSSPSNPTGKSSTGNMTVFERLSKRKKIFHEPTNEELTEYSKSGGGTNFRLSKIIADYEKAAEEQKGSVLMSVCRGRLSEGLDFRDNKCRMVIVVGIPYPPKQDLKVQLKEMYYNNLLANKNEWYARQASSAVNQAIGRVIRHSSDYGMILLLDARYTRRFHLSKWIEPHKKICNRFGDVTYTTSGFFQKWKKGLEETKEFRKAKRVDYEGGLGGANEGGKGGIGLLKGKIRLNLRRIELAYTTSRSLSDEEEEENRRVEDEDEQQQQQQEQKEEEEEDVNMREKTEQLQTNPFVQNVSGGGGVQNSKNKYLPQQLPPKPQTSLFIGRSNQSNQNQHHQQHQQQRFLMMNNQKSDGGGVRKNGVQKKRMIMRTNNPPHNPQLLGPPPLPPKSSSYAVNSVNLHHQKTIDNRVGNHLHHQQQQQSIIPPPPIPPFQQMKIRQENGNMTINQHQPNNNNQQERKPPPRLTSIVKRPPQRPTSSNSRLQQQQNPHPPPPPTKEKKRRTNFLERLRGTLTNEEYGRFKGFILEIRNQSRDFEKISSDVIDLIGIHGKNYCEMFLENLPVKKREVFKKVWKLKDAEFRNRNLKSTEEEERNKKKRKRVEEEEEEDEKGVILIDGEKKFEPPKKKRKLDDDHNINHLNRPGGDVHHSSSSKDNIEVLVAVDNHDRRGKNYNLDNNNNNNNNNNQQNITSAYSPTSRFLRKPPQNKCMICKDVYKNPLSNPRCGHVACSDCWFELKNSGQPFRCPQCRKRVEKLHAIFY